MGLKTENSDYCDRTNGIVHGRLRRCGFVHADISVGSPQRGKKTSDSIQQQAGENSSRVGFDEVQFAGLGPCRVIFQFADSAAVLGSLVSNAALSCPVIAMSISLCPWHGLTSKVKCRFGGLKFRQLSISTSTFLDTSHAPLPPPPIVSRGCRAARQPGFGQSVAVSSFPNRFRSKCEMFKISTIDTRSQRTLVVEGTLIGSWVGELRTSWRTASQELGGRKLVIDLGNLTVISLEGEDAILDLMKEGAKFSRGGILTRHVLKQLTRKRKQESPRR
jgi:hypothetical protein